jgi:transposase
MNERLPTIEAHMHAFKYFGGRPQLIVYMITL